MARKRKIKSDTNLRDLLTVGDVVTLTFLPLDK